MFRHLFKLIWNKKKQNFLLITEMLVSFLVLFAVFSMMVYFYNNYKEPRGFNHENVWVVTSPNPDNIKSNDSLFLYFETIRRAVKAMPEVKSVTFTSGNVPFSMTTNTTGLSSQFRSDVRTNNYTAEAAYKETMGVQVAAGRWFSDADRAAKLKPVVLNKKLAAELFADKNPIGKTLGEHNFHTKKFDERFRVIGVIENIKDKGDYQIVENALYQLMDTGGLRYDNSMLLQVQPDVAAAFESRLAKTLYNLVGNGIEIEHLEKKRISKNKLALVPMIIMLIVGGFLIINVALGLFGVLWYNINKRRGEIGLRRAIGASGNAVSWQLVGEAMVLSTLALLIGFFFAVQFPLLRVFDMQASVYLIAIALSVVFIYLLVFLCALYPGKQAAAIYPAVALHEE